MISPADAEKMSAQLDAIDKEIGLMQARIRVLSAEIAKMRGKLGPLTPQQEEALEILTRGIINKIAHGPVSELRKQAGDPEGVHVIDAIRKAFHLK